MKASVVIANYNNAKFIPDCINSLKTQSYNDIEIIFFDDNSVDDSLKVIEKFQNVKIIKNKHQTNFGSLNQINAFKKAINESTGEIIFFLDSDDYFHINKIEKIINEFLDDDGKMIIYDFPIILNNNSKILQKKINKDYLTYWGYIHPTSCISVRKNFIKKVFDNVVNDKFTNIWLDLRILLFSKYIHRYDIIEDNLTFYRQSSDNVSSKFKKFSKKWWKRRNEAHDYFFYFIKKNNLEIKKNFDFYLTKFINIIIK